MTVLLCDNRLGIQVLQVGKSSEEVFHFVSHPLLLLWCLSVECIVLKCHIMRKTGTLQSRDIRKELLSSLLPPKILQVRAQVQVPSPRDLPPDMRPDGTAPAPPNPRSSALASRRRRRGP